MRCPNCGFDSPPEMRFCGQCGSPLAQPCGACGFPNPPGFRFCGRCGARLGERADLITLAQTPTPEVSDAAAKVDRAPVQLAGERRRCTVVVTDVRGSTDLLERMGTEGWVEIMNRVLQIMESEVYRYGGEVDQFRGDGLLAFFGATVAHEDDPERAVLAALRMQEALRSYASELEEREGIDLRLRVGVSTGEVVVASIGDSRHYSEDTAMGEAIALAARLESAAEPGTVLVSQNTYQLVETQFEWQPLGEISIRGLRQPIAVYRPLSARSDATHLHGLQMHGLSSPLIARGVEFQTLERCIHDLMGGRGGILMVTGDAGIGKSRLVAEVRQHVIRDGVLIAEVCTGNGGGSEPQLPLTWLGGRCRSYSQSVPYSMWLDLIRRWLGVREGESEAQTRDRLRRQVEALWGEHLSQHYPSLASFLSQLFARDVGDIASWEYYPYLATFLSLPLEEGFAERVRHLDAAGLRQQLFLAIRGWVEAMARCGPLVLAFEDLQWADTTSRDLLYYCLPICDHEPVLFLIVCRLDRPSAAWEFRHRIETEYPHRVTTVLLPPLTESQSHAMLDGLIGSNVLPPETRRLVLERAEGNPYYIEELVHSLIGQGALVRDAETGRWLAARDVDSLRLSDTLQSLLLARIDDLAPGERRVLQIAAVIGSAFWSDILQHLVGNEIAVNQALTALQRAQLIRERGRVPDLGMEYVFKSALIREAVYNSILSTQRMTYHRQAAECLAGLFSEREAMSRYSSMLAYHYRRAGQSDKELNHVLQAAHQAQEAYANAEALDHYTRALDLLDEMEEQTVDPDRLNEIRAQQFDALSRRRGILYLIGDFQAGRSDAQALLLLALQLDDDSWLIDALLQQPGARSWESGDELGEGLAMAEEALTLSRQLGDRRREMRCLYTISMQRHFVNDPTWQEIGERALDLAWQLDDRRFQALILTQMGTAYGWSDQPQRGMEHLEAALKICQDLDDKITEVRLLGQIGLQHERSGDYRRLLAEYHQKRLHISREIGYRQGEGDALISCGQTQGIYLGDFAGGLALLEEGGHILESIPGRVFGVHTETSALLRMTQILGMQGRYDEAFEMLQRALTAGEDDDHDIMRAGISLVSASLYRARGDEAHLRMALDSAAQASHLVKGNPLITRQYDMAAACETAAAHLGLAELLADEGEREAQLQQALRASQTALDIFQTVGFSQIVECISEEIFFRHSQALGANGYAAEAAEYLQRAYDEMMRKHDLIPPESPFRRTFLDIPLHCQIRAGYAARQ